jgi:hypothetical protein
VIVAAVKPKYSCINPLGNAVDWWFILKTPGPCDKCPKDYKGNFKIKKKTITFFSKNQTYK